MKKITLLVATLLLTIATCWGQSIACLKLESPLDGTLCEKIAHGHRTYTLEESTDISSSIRHITEAKAKRLIASNKELMAVHASTAKDIRRSKFELDIRKSAIQRCTYAPDPDKCYKDTAASTMADYDLDMAKIWGTKK
jgi:hypothetical protein